MRGHISLKRPGPIMARGGALLLLLGLGAEPGWSQTWQASTHDSRALLFGSAFAPGGSTTFSCTTPSPQGVPLIQTGDHEATRTDTPFDMIVSFSVDLIDPFQVPHQLPDVRIALDGVSYALPTVEYSDFFGSWTVWMQMTDDLFLAANRAQEMVVDPGLGTAFAYPVDGLADALQTAMAFCISGWEQQGEIVPGPLDVWRTGAVATRPAQVPMEAEQRPYVPARLLPLDAPPPEAAVAWVTEQCQGAFDVDPSYVRSVDLDEDGRPDFILNYSGVNCRGGLSGRVFCGAANCSIDVFLSTRGYADPAQFLAIDLEPVVDAEGRIGLIMHSTFSGCAGDICELPFFWDGTQFVQ